MLTTSTNNRFETLPLIKNMFLYKKNIHVAFL